MWTVLVCDWVLWRLDVYYSVFGELAKTDSNNVTKRWRAVGGYFGYDIFEDRSVREISKDHLPSGLRSDVLQRGFSIRICFHYQCSHLQVIVIDDYLLWMDFVEIVLLFRCKTACDLAGGSGGYNASYVNFSIPEDSNGAGLLSKCLRFTEKESVENFTCSPDQFDSEVEECSKEEFIFRDKVTSIANEVNIYCTHYRLYRIPDRPKSHSSLEL